MSARSREPVPTLIVEFQRRLPQVYAFVDFDTTANANKFKRITRNRAIRYLSIYLSNQTYWIVWWAYCIDIYITILFQLVDKSISQGSHLLASDQSAACGDRDCCVQRHQGTWVPGSHQGKHISLHKWCTISFPHSLPLYAGNQTDRATFQDVRQIPGWAESQTEETAANWSGGEPMLDRSSAMRGSPRKL